MKFSGLTRMIRASLLPRRLARVSAVLSPTNPPPTIRMRTRSAPGRGRWAPTRSETIDRPAPVARLLEELSALDRAYSPGSHGRWSAERRAERVDRCLAELFGAAAPPPGVALAAVGGYGRGEL